MTLSNLQKTLIAIVIVVILVVITIYIVSNNNSSLECKGDDDCNGSTVCSNGKCVQCAFDSDCPGQQTCENNHCKNPETVTCSDCTALNRVDPASYTSDPLYSFWDGDVQSDGTIILDSRATILAFNPDGTPKTSFGVNGVVDLDVLIDPAVNGSGSFYIDQDDSIIFCLFTATFNGGVAHIAKLNADGTLATSFGTNGVATIPLADINNTFVDVVPDSNGNLYAIPGLETVPKIVKFSSSGVLDTSFGTNGIAEVLFNTSNTDPSTTNLLGLFIYNDYLYVMVRKSYSSPTNVVAGFVKYDLDGNKDLTFGTNGQASYAPLVEGSCNDGSFDVWGRSGGIDSQGRLYIGGSIAYNNGVDCSDYPYTIFRWTPDGILDTSYGTDGIFRDTLPPIYSTGVSIYSESYSKFVFDPCTGNLITSVITYRLNTPVISYVLQVTPEGVAIPNASYEQVVTEDTYYHNSFAHPDGYLVVVKTDNNESFTLFECPNINYRQSTRIW